MLAVAMDGLLSALYAPGRIRFLPVHPPVRVGGFTTPIGVLLPVENKERSTSGPVTAAELAEGALYVICYRPLHRDAQVLLRLAQEYVAQSFPGLPDRLLVEANEARSDGDWVGTIGRLWTAVQLRPDRPELLDELAVSCLHFGFVTAARRNGTVAARLARASGAALNELKRRFPDFAPGHLHRAEFLAAAGDEPGAFMALREAMRLGLSDEILEEARDLVREMSGLTRGEKHGS